MNNVTKGAFIQSLRDISFIKEKIQNEKQLLERLEYKRFGKMKSPLDYDIVGYKGKEVVRELKGRTQITNDDIYDKNQSLDLQIEECKKRIEKYNNLVANTKSDLNKFKEPMRSILIYRFVYKKKLKVVCKKFKELCLDESGMYKYINRELDRYF